MDDINRDNFIYGGGTPEDFWRNYLHTSLNEMSKKLKTLHFVWFVEWFVDHILGYLNK